MQGCLFHEKVRLNLSCSIYINLSCFQLLMSGIVPVNVVTCNLDTAISTTSVMFFGFHTSIHMCFPQETLITASTTGCQLVPPTLHRCPCVSAPASDAAAGSNRAPGSQSHLEKEGKWPIQFDDFAILLMKHGDVSQLVGGLEHFFPYIGNNHPN